MNGNELAMQAESWKEELNDEIIPYFQSGNSERGQIAFNRWKDSVIGVLRQKAPNEAKNFQRLTHHEVWVAKRGEHPYDRFMREDGRTCIAFLEDLREAALKGKITFTDSTLDNLPSQNQTNNSAQETQIAEILRILHDVKVNLDRRAEVFANRILWINVSVVIATWIILALLTWKYTWEVMEPWTYFLGFFITISGYVYFAVTLHAPSPKTIYQLIVEKQKERNYVAYNFDIEKYIQIFGRSDR